MPSDCQVLLEPKGRSRWCGREECVRKGDRAFGWEVQLIQHNHAHLQQVGHVKRVPQVSVQGRVCAKELEVELELEWMALWMDGWR